MLEQESWGAWSTPPSPGDTGGDGRDIRDAPRAARQWGAADTLREATGSPWMPHEKRLHEPYLAAVRSGADETDWRAAWEEGRAMTLEEAIAYALEATEEQEQPGTG